MSAAQPDVAVGLIHHADGTPKIDRTWARALLIRHARHLGLQLVDIVETTDTDDVHALARRLARVVARAEVGTLLTDGVPRDLAAELAAEFGLRHEPASPQRLPRGSV